MKQYNLNGTGYLATSSSELTIKKNYKSGILDQALFLPIQTMKAKAQLYNCLSTQKNNYSFLNKWDGTGTNPGTFQAYQ